LNQCMFEHKVKPEREDSGEGAVNEEI